MDKRFVIFMVAAVAAMAVNQLIFTWWFPPAPAPQVAKVEAKADAKKKDAQALVAAEKAKDPKAEGAAAEPAADDKANAEQPPADQQAEQPPAHKPAGDQPPAPVAVQRVTLGSADPASPYRILAFFNNTGATLERLELNGASFRDLEDRTGALGYLAPADAPKRGGALVRVVGPGTPAALAGIKPDDVITVVGTTKVSTAAALFEALDQTEPDQKIDLTVLREGKELKLPVTLGWHPLAVIRPEFETRPVRVVSAKNHDPFSFQLTINGFDDELLAGAAAELKGVELQSGTWEVEAANESVVRFRKSVPRLGLEVTKTFRLERVSADEHADPDYPAYSLLLDVAIRNVGDAAHTVAYRLDGPTGLPTEGYWYAVKVSRSWGAAGLRDIITRFEGGTTTQVTPPTIAAEGFDTAWSNAALNYIAVDAQYFSAALIPKKARPEDEWFSEVRPIRVGAVPADKNMWKMTDVSFRLTSTAAELSPGGPPLAHQFQIFAGPKRPALLQHYVTANPNVTLRDLVYYGWFGFVAKPMLAILHAFHAVVGNYGLAIIMLTVLVRLCMFPLSRKQALSAQKMQELQPELKRITDKFKNDAEKKMRAQQQLFREHNYHPLGGCLLAFVQLPIFVGLYRSLSVDVELRQAPLISDAIRWASNLAAPDMFWNWSALVPQFVSEGNGFFGLGPYLNILPLVTIGLFIWQQKMFMPPPADEQAALQQKMMQYMMIFMGFLFFKVASGLCVYFIASSIWGIAERKLLPKAKSGPSESTGGALVSAATTTSENGSGAQKKRQKNRR